MTLAQTVATHAANEFINFNAQKLDMQDKLLLWQQVYDTTLGALVFFESELQEQRREALLQASVN